MTPHFDRLFAMRASRLGGVPAATPLSDSASCAAVTPSTSRVDVDALLGEYGRVRRRVLDATRADEVEAARLVASASDGLDGLLRGGDGSARAPRRDGAPAASNQCGGALAAAAMDRGYVPLCARAGTAVRVRRVWEACEVERRQRQRLASTRAAAPRC